MRHGRGAASSRRRRSSRRPVAFTAKMRPEARVGAGFGSGASAFSKSGLVTEFIALSRCAPPSEDRAHGRHHALVAGTGHAVRGRVVGCITFDDAIKAYGD